MPSADGTFLTSGPTLSSAPPPPAAAGPFPSSLLEAQAAAVAPATGPVTPPVPVPARPRFRASSRRSSARLSASRHSPPYPSLLRRHCSLFWRSHSDGQQPLRHHIGSRLLARGCWVSDSVRTSQLVQLLLDHWTRIRGS